MRTFRQYLENMQQATGLYVAMKIDPAQANQIAQWVKQIVPPNSGGQIAPPQEYHVTVYSHAKADGRNFQPHGAVNQQCGGLDQRSIVFLPTSNKQGYNLVVDLRNAPWIIARSKEVSSQLGVVPPYPTVSRPHLTLAYHVQRFDVRAVAPFPLQQVTFTEEYAEPFEGNWKDTLDKSPE
jgi:hypothetical protein